MKQSRKSFGAWGEKVAADYLEAQGYEILNHNVTTPYGEIDIIAQRDQVIVFVEVKTRSSASFGFPEEAITAEKKKHLVESAQTYMQENPHLDGDWRIDVIAICSFRRGERPEIRHFENAI